MPSFFIWSIDCNGQGGSIEDKKKFFVVRVLLLQTETLHNYDPVEDVIFGRFGLQQEIEENAGYAYHKKKFFVLDQSPLAIGIDRANKKTTHPG